MNTKHQLKSKLVRLMCPKSIKLKQKWYRSNATVKNDVLTWL